MHNVVWIVSVLITAVSSGTAVGLVNNIQSALSYLHKQMVHLRADVKQVRKHVAILPVHLNGTRHFESNLIREELTSKSNTNLTSHKDQQLSTSDKIIEGKLEIIEHSVNIMKGKIDKTEKDVDDIKTIVSNIVYDLPNIKTMINITKHIEDDIEYMKDDISTIKGFNGMKNEIIKSVESKNFELETKINEYGNAISNTTASNEICNTDYYHSDLENIAAKISFIEDNINNVTLGILKLENSVGHSKSEMDIFRNEINNITEIFRTLERKFNNSEELPKAIGSNIKTLQTTISLVPEQISTLQGIISSDANKLEQIHSMINDIKTVLENNIEETKSCNPPYIMVPDLACLLFDSSYRTWDGAVKFCQENRGLHLAIVDTEEKCQALNKYIRRQEYSYRWWLGGNDRTGSWTWSNGKPVTEGWQKEGNQLYAQPNQDEGHNTCIYWWKGYDGLWDSSCSEEYRAICQKY
ncbi:unnamed protein product [Meganyctiphanes norvegica]|uniref:C-type lectin domain-containing protein n=1 Tax=Meganyctiphanes norvegica TaxID=48144 RepID=A0AAV2SM17_MEGNR